MSTTFKTRTALPYKAFSIAGAALVTAVLIGAQLGIANDYVAQADAVAVAKAQNTLAQKGDGHPAPRSPS